MHRFPLVILRAAGAAGTRRRFAFYN